MKTVRYAIQATFLILLSILFFFFVMWSLNSSFRPAMKLAKMKCNDPDINNPMVSDKGWNMFLVAIGFFINLSIIIPALLKKIKPVNGVWYNCLVFLRPGLIFFIGFCATFVLVQNTSRYLGLAAPNFIAACQPDNVTSLCNVTSTRYVIVNCTTEKSWVPASSSFPSVITTMQAFDMLFLALYVNYRIKSKANRHIKFIASLIALIFTLTTGCVTIYCNEAYLSDVWIGCVVGGTCAGLTMMCLGLLEWEKTENLPRFWNDPLPDGRKLTIPRQTLDPLPSGHSVSPPPSSSLFGDPKNHPPPVSRPPVNPPPYPGIYPTAPPIEWK